MEDFEDRKEHLKWDLNIFQQWLSKLSVNKSFITWQPDPHETQDVKTELKEIKRWPVRQSDYKKILPKKQSNF